MPRPPGIGRACIETQCVQHSPDVSGGPQEGRRHDAERKERLTLSVQGLLLTGIGDEQLSRCGDGRVELTDAPAYQRSRILARGRSR
jgi:hypothetical protein